MEKGLKNLTQVYRQAQRKQAADEEHHDDSGIGISDLDDDSYEEANVNLRAMLSSDTPTRIPAGRSTRPYRYDSLPRLGPVPRTGMTYASRITNTDPNQTMNIDAPKAASGTRKGCRRQTYEAVTERPITSTDLRLLDSSDYSSDVDAITSPSVASEDSAEADMNEIDLRKELLLDRLMLQFYSIFDAQSSPLRQHQGSTESPEGSPCKGMVSNPASSKSTTKHGRSFEEDGEDKESGDRPRKRPQKVSNDNTNPNHEKKKHLACPFFKHDPTKTCVTKSCSGPGGWKDIPRLK